MFVTFRINVRTSTGQSCSATPSTLRCNSVEVKFLIDPGCEIVCADSSNFAPTVAAGSATVAFISAVEDTKNMTVTNRLGDTIEAKISMVPDSCADNIGSVSMNGMPRNGFMEYGDPQLSCAWKRCVSLTKEIFINN